MSAMDALAFIAGFMLLMVIGIVGGRWLLKTGIPWLLDWLGFFTGGGGL